MGGGLIEILEMLFKIKTLPKVSHNCYKSYKITSQQFITFFSEKKNNDDNTPKSETRKWQNKRILTRVECQN